MSKKIMTVDDSISVRMMVGFALKGAGYEVVEAVDGIDALEKLKAEPCHMVIADVNMPNMNGIELVRAIREDDDHKFTPIIMLTTEATENRKHEGREAGATGWIVKPFKPDQLLSVVERVLQ
jgi:two-component system chemotaxis response regulator CheY